MFFYAKKKKGHDFSDDPVSGSLWFSSLLGLLKLCDKGSIENMSVAYRKEREN